LTGKDESDEAKQAVAAPEHEAGEDHLSDERLGSMNDDGRTLTTVDHHHLLLLLLLLGCLGMMTCLLATETEN